MENSDTLIIDAGLGLDVSFQKLSPQQLLEQIKLPADFSKLQQQLLRGEYKNVTEDRMVTHTLCRSIHAVTGIGDKDSRFAQMVKKLRSGRWLGATGKPIKSIVNVGVGGSDLGPKMGASALREFANNSDLQKLDVHFVSSMDGEQLYDLLPLIAPETTLFIIASKSFGTIDTLANIDTIRDWAERSIASDDWLANHVVGISSNAQRMTDYGIPAAHQLTFGEGVGGRYSLWSAIGFSIAIKSGLRTFERVLAGAKKMDEHFAQADLSKNIPILMALYGIYNREELNINNLAVLTYDGRLQLLPSYLQQLDMESNGKQADVDNKKVNYPTGPILWGGHGPNGQHAFYQHLHQGHDEFSADFVLIIKRDAPGAPPEVAKQLALQQKLSVANCLAHRQLMAFGNKNPDSPRDDYPGGHPSNLLFMDELTPESFGALIAAYEHKVFVQGIYWRINSFDQPGVELGKRCATDILNAIDSSDQLNFDASTNRMVDRVRS